MIVRFLGVVCISWVLVCAVGQVAADQPVELAKPSTKQIAFADWEIGAFFHYDLNPFTGQEHGDGLEPASKFNPTDLDAEQWVLTAKAMGARYAVLTARHEGGFCLWPTKTHGYSVASSPWKDGKGDVVREFVDACRKHGLKVGLYHTASHDAYTTLRDFKGIDQFKRPLDWMTTWGQAMAAAHRADPTLKERYKRIQLEQVRELLTWYGPIDFMWSDHWNAQDPDGVWRAVTDLVAELQPGMVFMGPDTWVPGNETGHVVYPMWNAVHTVDGTKYSRPAPVKGDVTTHNDYGLLEGDVRAGHPFGKFWRVRECTTNTGFHYGGWFWHPDHVKKTYPRQLWEHMDLYYRTVGLGANTIINLPIDTRGRVPDEFVAAAKAFGDEVRTRFSNPVAQTQGVQIGDVVELSWGEPRRISTVVTMEHIAEGQRVARYTLEAWVEGKWQELEPRNYVIAWPPYNASPGYRTIGHKKIDRVSPVVTNRVRFRCLESIAKPVQIRSIAVYDHSPVPQTFRADYPYLSGVPTIFELAHGNLRRDINYHGESMSLGGKTYQHGLLICPAKQTRFGLAEFDMTRGPQAKAMGMIAVVGIEDSTGDAGSCQFVVEGKVDGEWRELYRSPKLTGASKPLPIRVAFPKGMIVLRLKSTDSGDNIHSDHAAWADAKFWE